MEYDVSKMMFFKANPTGEHEFAYDFVSDAERLDVANQITKGKVDAYIKVLNHIKEFLNNMDLRDDGYATVNSLKAFVVKTLHINGFTLSVFSDKDYTGIHISGGTDTRNNISNIRACWYDIKRISVDDKIDEAFLCAVDTEKDFYINNDPYGKALNELVSKAFKLAPYGARWNIMDIGQCIKNGIHPSLEEINDRITKLDGAIKTSKDLEEQEKTVWNKYWDSKSVLQAKIDELKRQMDNLSKESDNERAVIQEKEESLWKNSESVYNILLSHND